MTYEKDFIRGVGREDISLTKEDFQKDLEDQNKRNETIAKYGVFLREILSTLIRKQKFPKEIEKEDLINEFLFKKFPRVATNYTKRKGPFRAYLRISFINYLVDRIYKAKKERVCLVSCKPEEIHTGNEEDEQEIYENFDQEFLKPLFKELDQRLAGQKEIPLLMEYYLHKERFNFSLFSIDDFKDLPRFLRLIGEPKDALSRYIWEFFSLETRESIDVFLETNELPKKAQQQIVKELNYLLRDDSLYSEKRFAHLELGEKIYQLIKQNPQRQALNTLNRSLLENAYSQDIEKSRKSHPSTTEKRLTKYQKKQTKEFLKKETLKVLQNTPHISQASSQEELLAEMEYFLKLYFREKFVTIQ